MGNMTAISRFRLGNLNPPPRKAAETDAACMRVRGGA